MRLGLRIELIHRGRSTTSVEVRSRRRRQAEASHQLEVLRFGGVRRAWVEIMLCRRSRAPAASWPAVSTKRLIWLSGAPVLSETAQEAFAESKTRMTTTKTTTIRKPVALSSGKWTRVNNSSQLKWPSNLLALVAALSLLTLVGRDSNTSGRMKAEIAAKSDSGQPVNQQADNEPHPSSMVDTKYWVSSTQFNEPRNWLDNKKPCTLIEPIVISEQDVIISMGGDARNSLGGALESNIRDLILAQDGILLLDSDNAGQSRTDDKMFIQQLNESGDCFDSSALSTTDFTELGAGGEAQMFKFEPYSDDMSWFNPANWRSKLYADAEIAHLVPESNQIPCSEDMVVFGHSQSVAPGDTSEPSGDGGSGQPTTFKVKFRPSEQYEGPANLVSLASLRVSRLTIGDRSYNQTDFDRLIDLYGDNLFDFADNKSVFNRPLAAGGDSSANDFQLDRQNNILTIDESSTQLGAHELCQDEAGCQCGNDRPDLMRIICSFSYEPDSSQLPCYDPIQAPGYCKKICATSILIHMDPTRFSEHYIFSILEYLDKLGPTADASSVDSSSPSSSSSSSSLSQPENYYTSNIFVGARRIDYNKYDITLHLMVKDDADYISAIGQDVEYAKVIKEHLEKAATKSFYGIKGVAIKSSVRWRRNNRRSAFIISFIVMVSISTFFFVHYDKYPGVALLISALSMLNYQFRNNTMRTTKRGPSDDQRPPGPSYITEPKILDEIVSISDLPVVSDIIKDDPRRQANNVDLVELDTQSISGSTHNLIDPVAD